MSFTEANCTVPQLRVAALKSLRLESVWDSASPTPLKKPRFLCLQPQQIGNPGGDSEKIAMLRILPGGKYVLTTTYSARVLCWDLRDGALLGEWRHGGAKVESLDVDVVKDHTGRPCIVLAVSVEHHYLHQGER